LNNPCGLMTNAVYRHYHSFEWVSGKEGALSPEEFAIANANAKAQQLGYDTWDEYVEASKG